MSKARRIADSIDELTTDEIRHSIRPSLLLDFANSKTLDPRIDFTRSSTATYYDGKTHAKAEENIYKYSQEFNNGDWSNIRLWLTNDATTAPDGTTTAYATNQASGETTAGNIRVSPFVLSAATHTFSIYAKANTKDYLHLSTNYTSTTGNVWFDLSTGTIGTSNNVDSSSITDVGNGWYRCVVTITVSNTNGVAWWHHSDTDGSTTVTDSGGIYIWGAQLEQRSSVTAYTPTTTQPITNYIPVLQTAASGTSRFDHDPVTGESKGLLIEEQRTNLLPYSYFAPFTGIKTVEEENAAIAPDGTLTAHLAAASDITGTHYLGYNLSGTYTDGQNYTFSCFVKPRGDWTYPKIRIHTYYATNEGSGQYADFDLSSISILNEINGASNSTITHVGNDWYRISTTVVVDSEATYPSNLLCRVTLLQDVSAISTSYAGDGYKGFLLWGAQLEAGAFPTSYIPTSGSQVTRSGDSASMTGDNFSSWYRQDEGTVYSETMIVGSDSSTFSGVYRFSDGTANNRYGIFYRPSTSGMGYASRTNSVADVGVSHISSITSDLANTWNKVSFVYNVNDFAASLDGGTVTTDTSGNCPIVSELRLGYLDNYADSLHIKKLAYYPTRLTNAELVALTED